MLSIRELIWNRRKNRKKVYNLFFIFWSCQYNFFSYSQTLPFQYILSFRVVRTFYFSSFIRTFAQVLQFSFASDNFSHFISGCDDAIMSFTGIVLLLSWKYESTGCHAVAIRTEFDFYFNVMNISHCSVSFYYNALLTDTKKPDTLNPSFSYLGQTEHFSTYFVLNAHSLHFNCSFHFKSVQSILTH